MNIFDYMSADRSTMLSIAVELLDDERERIVTQKLASREEVNGLLDAFITEMRHRVALGQKAGSDDLAHFHRQLKSVILPGDFNKVSGEFYDLSNLPKLKEKDEEEKLQYKLPEKEVSEEVADEAEEKLEAYLEAESLEDEAKDKGCDCGPKCKCGPDCKCGPGCACKKEDKSDDKMALLLAKLDAAAYKLGSQGNHPAALEIERTMRYINRHLQDKKTETEG